MADEREVEGVVEVEGACEGAGPAANANTDADPGRAQLAVGQVVRGFEVVRAESLPEIDGVAYELRHLASGVPLLWLANDDENKAFAIAFKTPPADDTGVFHILEHSVLCGSDKYPVKEPFVNLLKTSMQTFLNAMTFADKTMYPVASTNEQDLLNLIDVYMDAVLHPALYRKRTIFEQEGWHYELDTPEEPLRYNGVVLNEMKGALSDPEDVCLQALSRALFPDTAYGFESGGNPRAIPTLTYEAYLDTHARHYNLGNARIVLYGDLQVERELGLLDEGYLCASARAERVKEVERARGAEGTKVGAPNPLVEQAPVVNLDVVRPMATTPENATVMVGYVLGSFRERTRMLAADVLLDALMGSNEAPLKRALLDADLGSDVDAFLYDGLLQPYVVFELRGAHPGSAARFRETLESAVRGFVEGGVPRTNVEASLESASFTLRERDYGYADGVALAVNAMSGWLYDEEMATTYLRFEDALAELRAGLDSGYFEELLRTAILQSNHKAQVELRPLAEDEGSDAAAEKAELAAIKESLTPEQVCQIIDETAELHRLQGLADTPEQLATLPMLTRRDLGEARPEPQSVLMEDTPLPCLYHPLPTNRINYVYHYFDLSHLTWDELPYATLLASLLGKMATKRHSAAELDTLIEARLGRLTFSNVVQLDVESGVATPRMVVGVSAIEENLLDMVRIPTEVWGSTLFDDVERIRTVLQQQKLNLEQSFVNAGNSFALGRADAYTDAPSLLSQHFGGVDYYRFCRDLLARFDEAAPELPAKLTDICGRIFVGPLAEGRGGVRHGVSGVFHHVAPLTSFTGSERACKHFWELGNLLGLPTPTTRGKLALEVPEPAVLREAFVIPSDVCFVAKSDSGAHTQAAYSGTWSVAERALNYGYLWDEVRVKGGAYGCSFRAKADGGMGYSSFRDPNLDATLERFDRAGAWLAEFAPSEQEMTGYVVSTVAAHDAPRKPRLLARRQDVDFLTRRDPSWRDMIRAQARMAEASDIRPLAPALDRVAERDAVCVFGSREILERSQAGLTVIDLFGGE